jgi:hypothetical protein
MTLKEFIIILTITFIVLVSWIVFNILHDKSSEPIDPNLQSVLEPVNPNFDQEILDKLKNISLKAPPTIQTKPVPTPTPAPFVFVATPSAVLTNESSESASPSSDLTPN